MRWLINYFRSCFCKHEWEKVWENENKQLYYWGVFRCKKCGHIQKIEY